MWNSCYALYFSKSEMKGGRTAKCSMLWGTNVHCFAFSGVLANLCLACDQLRPWDEFSTRAMIIKAVNHWHLEMDQTPHAYGTPGSSVYDTVCLTWLHGVGCCQQAEMELEHMVGMQPVLYHRYHEDEGEEDDEGGAGVDGDDDSELFHNTAAAAATGGTIGINMLTDSIHSIDSMHLNHLNSSWLPIYHDTHGLHDTRLQVRLFPGTCMRDQRLHSL